MRFSINQFLFEPIDWLKISAKNAETIRHLLQFESYDSKTFIAKMLNNEIPIWVLLSHRCIIDGEYKFVFNMSEYKEEEVGRYIATILQNAIDSNDKSTMKKIASNLKLPQANKRKSLIVKQLHKQREKLYKIISDQMNWKYELFPNYIIFSDMRKFKKQAV